MTNLTSLDAAARDELARGFTSLERSAQRVLDANGEDERERAWKEFHEWARPETILALLASVRGAEADTRDAERYRFLRDNPLQLRAIDGNANICGSIKAESVDQWTDIAMLDAARAHPPIQETDADASL